VTIVGSSEQTVAKVMKMTRERKPKPLLLIDDADDVVENPAQRIDRVRKLQALVEETS
jgi:hypothetical protein